MAACKTIVADKIEASSGELTSALDEYNNVKGDMDRLFKKFKEVGFETTVCKQEMPYDADTILTENNICGYFQEIEELISYMITYQAVRTNEPNASLASVAVKHLPEKSFDKKVNPIK
jgi:hypothetical protein